MKRFAPLLALLLALPAWAEHAPAPPQALRMSEEATASIFCGKNREALDLFRKAWVAGAQAPKDAYNAACAASRLGLLDEAVVWLHRSLAIGFHDADHLAKDPDLAPLHGDPRFADISERACEAQARAEAAIEDKPLSAELVHRANEASELRKQLHERAAPSLKRQLAELDGKNAAFIKGVVDKRGWPGRKLVGDKGEWAVWQLVLNASGDRAFQRRALPLLEKAIQAGDATPRAAAFLVDELLVAEQKPQLYGTRFTSDDKGAQVPFPIEDAPRVDERRAQVGLPPLEVYQRAVNEMARPTAEK
jgi:hypothetical protein